MQPFDVQLVSECMSLHRFGVRSRRRGEIVDESAIRNAAAAARIRENDLVAAARVVGNVLESDEPVMFVRVGLVCP